MVGRGQAGPERAPGSTTTDVIVVGAGVSGCACAAALAAGGAEVILMGSALDATGLPGHGPAVTAASGQWEEIEEVLRSLPAILRRVWVEAASVPESGAPMLIVDRRAVSVETKRALEQLHSLHFRQGLVEDVRVVRGPTGEFQSVEVETIFGEVLSARRVVLAVGLALGGHVRVGAQEMEGGRYGELPATGLRAALETAGAILTPVEEEVGERYGGNSPVVAQAFSSAAHTRTNSGLVPVRRLLESAIDLAGGASSLSPAAQVALRLAASVADSLERTECRWPDGLPPPPHRTKESDVLAALLTDPARDPRSPQAAGARESVTVLDKSPVQAAALLLPDGIATDEYWSPTAISGPTCSYNSMMVRPLAVADNSGPEMTSGAGAPVGSLDVASRLRHKVDGLVLGSLDSGHRVPQFGCALWAVGRVSGAKGYLDSLRSGVDCAQRLLRLLEDDSDHGV